MAKGSAGKKATAAVDASIGDVEMDRDLITDDLHPAQIADGTDDPMADPTGPGDEDDESEMFDPELSSGGEEDENAEEASNVSADEEEDASEEETEMGGAPLTTRESLSPSAVPLIGAKSSVAESTILDTAIPTSLHVSKPIPYTYDAGHLLINDANPLPASTPTTLEATFTATARDAAQSLLNHLLTTCPIHTLSTTSTSSSGVEMTLPPPIYQLPREKKVPEPKPPTKWERFAAKKGITKKGQDVQGRDGKMVYDEASGEWVPKWGYKGKNKKGEGDWLVEVDDKAEKKAAEKDGVVGLNPRNVSRQERMEKIKRNERAQRANQRKGRKGAAA